MAIFALCGGVRTEQWETVLVIFHLLHCNIPALHRMALCAIRAHLSLMDVGVAVLAILSDVCENRFHMALRALHFFVHAAERVFCLGVIKFGNGPNRPPSRGGVTILTGNGECTMRTAAALPLRRWCRSVGADGLPREEQEPAQNLNKPKRNCPLYIRLPTIRLRRPGCSETRADA